MGRGDTRGPGSSFEDRARRVGCCRGVRATVERGGRGMAAFHGVHTRGSRGGDGWDCGRGMTGGSHSSERKEGACGWGGSADRAVSPGRERRGRWGRDWDGLARPKGRGVVGDEVVSFLLLF
jgi:hypothetical protein